MIASATEAGLADQAASLDKECNAALRAKDFPTALAAAEKVATMLPGSLPAQLRLCGVLMQSGQPEAAAPRLRDIITAWPDAARAHAALARALLRLGDVGGAIAASAKAASLEPESAKYHEQHALALMKADRVENAAEAMARAATLDPESAPIQAVLCRLLWQMGEDEPARAAGLRSLELDPDQPVVARLLRSIVAPEDVPGEGRTALDGQDGFMFHESDAAFVQMCGAPAQADDATELARILKSRNAWCVSRKITYRMLIVPERHVLYDDKLPAGYTSQPDRMAVQLMQAIQPDLADVVLYPYAIMREARARREVCIRQDVHWSPYGAYLGYRALIESVPELAGEIVPESELQSRIVRRVGDMAIWRGLRTREPCEMLEPPKAALREIMSTKTFATGQVDVFETDHTSGRRLVMFRTSNSTALLPFLAHHFSRIVTMACTTPAFDLLESERPNYVFSELPERYLAVPAHGGGGGIRLPRDFATKAFLDQTGCSLPLPGAA